MQTHVKAVSRAFSYVQEMVMPDTWFSCLAVRTQFHTQEDFVILINHNSCNLIDQLAHTCHTLKSQVVFDHHADGCCFTAVEGCKAVHCSPDSCTTADQYALQSLCMFVLLRQQVTVLPSYFVCTKLLRAINTFM